MVLDPYANSSQLQNGLRSEPVRNGQVLQLPPSAAPADNDGDEELSIRQILAVLQRRALILAGVTFTSATATSAVILTRPPEYSGTFRLLAEPVTKGSRLAENLTSDTLQTLKPLTERIDSTGSSLDYISQIEVLRSQTLLDPIIARIQKRYPEIDYRTLMQRLKIVRPKDSKILEFTYASTDQEEIKFVLSELSQAFIQYSISDRQTNLRRGVEFVEKQIARQRQDVSRLEIALEDFRRKNNLIDPKVVADAVSQQIQSIIANQKDNRVKLAASLTLFANLKQQVGSLPGEAIDTATLSEAPTYQKLLAQLRELDAKIATESARFTPKAPAVQALQDQRSKLLPVLRAEAQRVMGANAPRNVTDPENTQYQGAVRRELTQQLVQAANEVQVLRSQDVAITQAIAQLRRDTQTMAGVARIYGQLQRELEIATASLNRLATARENLQLESARQASPWELISRIDESNITPKMSLALLLLLGVLASAIIGIAAALIAEQLDRVYHTVDDLKETKLPCIGVVPFNVNLGKEANLKNVGRMASTKVPDVAPNKKSKRYTASTFFEAFYSLDANIRLLSSDSPIRSVTMTSTSPADGKSTIAAHLAWAAVTMGRKVLLIDTDLRRPQVHKWFGISNIRGLSNAITSDVDAKELIQESPQDPNLHLLPAGPNPPAPGRLLASNKMRVLMDQLTKEYDLVICDAPPLYGFADAKLVAPYTDGILLVVGLGKTDRGSLMQVLDELRNTSHSPVLGIIANGLKRYTIGYYYYYQRYYNQKNLPEEEEMLATPPKR